MRFYQLVQAAENKYNRLLTTLIVIYLTSPFFVDRPVGNFVVFFVFLGSIIIVAYQIQRSRRTLSLYIGLVLVALLLRSLSYLPSTSLNFNRLFDVFSTIIFLAFLSLSIYLILRELTIARQVTADIIKGGLCVYFLFGFLWTALYGIIYSLDANSFHAASSVITRADLAHFSFTTLSTVGYGDITPVSEIARVLANLEGMVGVMYPAIFIARLVGLHSNH
jgi:hypothetical protein